MNLLCGEYVRAGLRGLSQDIRVVDGSPDARLA
jgi:hypothetical protein